MVVTIYLDNETTKSLEEIRNNNHQFNLSGFVTKMIKEYTGDEEKVDVEKTQHMINNINLEITKLEEKKRFLINRIKSTEKIMKIQQDEEMDKIIDIKESILKYCDVDEEAANILAQDYLKVMNRTSITLFIQEREIKLK